MNSSMKRRRTAKVFSRQRLFAPWSSKPIFGVPNFLRQNLDNYDFLQRRFYENEPKLKIYEDYGFIVFSLLKQLEEFERLEGGGRFFDARFPQNTPQRDRTYDLYAGRNC